MHISQVMYSKAMAAYEKSGDFGQLVYAAAKMYAADGLKVVPLRMGQKILVKEAGGYSKSFSQENIAEQFAPGKKYHGYNIGLVCGGPGNVFALDVDRHGDSDGVDTLTALTGENGELPFGPVATTPRGGLHYLFAPAQGVGNSVSLIGPGLDTRGSKQDGTPAGHIACWPSVVDGKMYMWQSFGDVPEAPSWLIQMLTGRDPGALGALSPPPQIGSTPPMAGRTQGNVVYMDLDQSADVHNMLRVIDPNKLGYEEWLRVGMAVHSNMPTRDGLLVWDEWSRRGEKYMPGECHSRWDGFKPVDGTRNAITLGTLAIMAQPFGYRVPKSLSDEIGDESFPAVLDIVKEFNETHALVLTNPIRVLEWEKGKDPMFMSVRDAGIVYSNNKKMYTKPDGATMMCPVFDTWIKHPNRLSVRRYGLYDPDNTPKDAFNLWEGWAVQPAVGDPSVYINHVRNRICRGNDEVTTWVLDWVADMFQNPFVRPGTALVIRGGEGTGKGAMVEVLGRMVGRPFGKITSGEHIGGRFNANIQDKLLIFVDEATFAGGHRANSFLKNLVTSPTLSIERKGVDTIESPNLARLVVCTNDEWAIPAGVDSRRWAVMDTAPKMPGDNEYFRDLFDWMADNEGVLLHYFLNRKIASDLATAPVTKALKYQRALTSTRDKERAGPLQWLAGLVFSDESFPIPPCGKANVDADGWPTAISVAAAYEFYVKDHNDNRLAGNVMHKMSFSMAITRSTGMKVRDIRHETKCTSAIELPSREDLKSRLLELMPEYGLTLGEDE